MSLSQEQNAYLRDLERKIDYSKKLIEHAKSFKDTFHREAALIVYRLGLEFYEVERHKLLTGAHTSTLYNPSQEEMEPLTEDIVIKNVEYMPMEPAEAAAVSKEIAADPLGKKLVSYSTPTWWEDLPPVKDEDLFRDTNNPKTAITPLEDEEDLPVLTDVVEEPKPTAVEEPTAKKKKPWWNPFRK